MKSSLPIDDYIPDILQRLASENNLIILAAPGAGKTTRLPPALLSIVARKILILEPRRMAAIAAAHRIAEENGWVVGEEVGYQVRFNNKTSSKTRLIFMTEALLARRMIHDPELQDVDVVILDEFHERSLYVDLTLGLLRELQELGRAIKIIVMSATLDAEKISRYLGDAVSLSVPGKLFPLVVHHQKSHQLLKTQNNFYENLVRVIQEAQKGTDKDILLFLPGIGEIERIKGFLFPWAEEKKIEIISLHGSMQLEDQRNALKKSARQRIILATNIAESSVTLDGVNTVIDSGLVKIMKHDLRTGFSRLELTRISLSSAIQRGGRAARQFPGVNYRLWSKADESSFGRTDVPEILRSDLSESLLFLAAQGIQNFDSFAWFEKPSSVSIEYALRTLKSAGALNEKNELLEMGRKILHFPLPIRLGRLLIAGIENGCLELAAKISALLQERDILRKNTAVHFLGDNLECDLILRLNILNEFFILHHTAEGNMSTLRTVNQHYQQILHLAKQLSQKMNTQHISTDLSENEARQLLLVLAYSDRLCRRRKNSDRALMVGGRGVKLSDDSVVKKSEFFIALNGIEGSDNADTLVSLACGIEKDFLLTHFSDKIILKKEVIFNDEKEKFYQAVYRSLWDLPIEEPLFSLATSAQVSEKLPEILTDHWDRSLLKNKHLNSWWQKVTFVRSHMHYLPSDIQTELADIFEGDCLNKSFRLEAFSKACVGESKMDEVFKKNLIYFFEINMSHNLRRILQEELPNNLKVPSGSILPIHYPQGKAPYVEVRIQEIFGLNQTPTVLFQSIPIVLHLLAPNFRPVQITSNLESFWQNGYSEVRKEFRIRYPKHQWPEDPANGVAEAKGRRRPKS